ncbi:hypothetical protein [Sporosalibacterium faouarense]|uniref:hypothetical protein n=1 Tax=Sporosalibacterium faouarense TaxID=516123 RepID=UPI00141D5737|nr:hypothetical protein [Sporosalibacterium faouarense]MTI47634.1 hypothetical protein [Bacillota bacterium]
MVSKILFSIIVGGFLGTMIDLTVRSAADIQSGSPLNGFFSGIIAGLLIYLIVEVDKLSRKENK